MLKDRKQNFAQNRNQWQKICTFALAIVVPVILDIVVFGFLGDKISQNNLWWIVSAIIIATISVFALVWHFISKYLCYVHFNDKRKISKTCAFKNGNCCGDAVCDTISVNYSVNPDVTTKNRIADEYSLYLQDYIQDKETNFSQKNGDEIWIMSSNLNSEIFEANNSEGITNAVKQNIQDGIKYYYVYFEDVNDPETIERNKRNITNALDNSDNVKFVSLGTGTQRLDEYILYLCGIVIYIDKNGQYEGYFSLRNHEIAENTEPIYYKMPVCIAGKYLNIMRDAKKKAVLEPNSTPNIKIEELTTKDYHLIEKFILEQHEQLPNKDYFIIDDIKEELPKILGDMGIMFGLFLNNELVSIQAVEFSQSVHTTLMQNISSKYINRQLAEIGWTMTKQGAQGNGYARILLKQLESKVTHNYDFVATVHPDNIASLNLYLNNGYIGVSFKKIFGLPRIFLLKTRSNINLIDTVPILVSTQDDLEKHLNNGYVCCGVDIVNEKMCFLLCQYLPL